MAQTVEHCVRDSTVPFLFRFVLIVITASFQVWLSLVT
jgi:hypothetical protein